MVYSKFRSLPRWYDDAIDEEEWEEDEQRGTNAKEITATNGDNMITIAGNRIISAAVVVVIFGIIFIGYYYLGVALVPYFRLLRVSKKVLQSPFLACKTAFLYSEILSLRIAIFKYQSNTQLMTISMLNWV